MAGREPKAIKLFVGQIPRDWSEDQVKEIFTPYGEIHSMNLLYDKAYPGQHRGCAFIKYYEQESAEKAQAELHERKYLPGMRKPMQVKPQGKPENQEQQTGSEYQDEGNRNLFVGMISQSTTDVQLRNVFGRFGDIEQINILREKNCAFVKFRTVKQANAAIKNVNGKITLEGNRQPMVVKGADTDQDKLNRKQAAEPKNPFAGVQQAALANGIATLAAQVAYYEQVFTRMELPQVIAAAPGAPLAETLARTVGRVPPRIPLGATPVNGAMFGVGNQSFNPTVNGKDGPEGANLFIYHIPVEFNDMDLMQTFTPFGTILNSKVIIDKETGQSKGYGFISFDNVDSATIAIASMNGFAIGGRKLQVGVRKKKEKPYEK